jgi:KUP system potassium uptake protein
MLATTVLLSIAMREMWGWPLPAMIAIGLGFATIDGGFLSANLTKLVAGDWVPLLLGGLIFCVMPSGKPPPDRSHTQPSRKRPAGQLTC